MLNVYEQAFTEDDAIAAYETVKSGILSAFGPRVAELEGLFASFSGRPHGLTCNNGTAGLLLALHGLQIENCRVAVPSCSYAATAFASIHKNNRVEYVDADWDSWNLDLDILEEKCKYWADKDAIKCVIAVHTYGNPYDYYRLRDLSDKYGFKIIEDACEAICAEYDGKMSGSLGDVSVFSFYGNKLLSSGEGGIALSSDKVIHDRMKLLRSQGQDPNRRFWHLIPGFNYRLTNVQASIVLSQMKRVKQLQEMKLAIAAAYEKWLPKYLNLQSIHPKAKHAWWMVSVTGPDDEFYERNSTKFLQHDIETRPIFPPLSIMPFNKQTSESPVALKLNKRGITLPSGPATKMEDIKRVCSLLE